MHRLIALTALVALATLATGQTISAQQFDQYGLRADRNSAPTHKPTNPVFDFSKNTANQTRQNPFSQMFSKGNSQRKPFRLFENMEMPKIEWPKLEMPKLARPSWLPERDPNAPNFFQRMNTKSKEAVDRFTAWAQGKSNELKQRQSASWDSIRATMDRINAQSSSSTQPSARTANGSMGSTRFK